MTSGGTADPSSFPAPGSAVPGAPPPLKRALTPADGRADHKAVSPPATERPEGTVSQNNSQCVRGSGERGLHLAAAMTGLAVGLEAARIISRRRNS